MRKTYRRLHAEGYVDNEAAVLVRAGEKLVIENKVFAKRMRAYEVQSLKRSESASVEKRLISIRRVNRKGRSYFLALRRLRGRASA